MMLMSVTMGIPYHEIRQWSAAEITLYQCYYRVAPWGEERGDIRNAMQMAQFANMHRDPAKSTQPFDITDFMPFADKPEDEHMGEPAGLRQGLKMLAGRK